MLRWCLFVFTALAVGVISSGLDAQEKKDKKAQPKAQPKAPPKKQAATAAETLAVPPGFKIELLHTADPVAEGSWICMCTDNKGRLIISGQQNQPTSRITLKDGKVEKIEKLDLPITGSMGLLYAFDSLYVNGIGPKGFGLYRCRDTKGNDQYDDVQFLKGFNGSGEHGPHGIALGKDNKLYIINGNHTDVPEGMSAQSPHRNYKEDLFLPRQWDGNGHAAGKLAPGGYVVRTDADGKEWDFVLGGFRNAYDIAFNGDGELFTYDSDMEWDWGMPWYRPTRVNHCTSGAEFGWRSGTGKWPSYYEDSLPATIDIGIGSPTGVGNGIGAKFPAKYQKAIYVLDWTYGRILAIHLTPNGSSYDATFENFVAPKGLTDPKEPKLPLNVTDVVIGNDGAMYFTIGGRNTQAALYRVTYTGTESTAPATLHDAAGADARKLRHDLEKFHGKVDPQAVAAAWPHLGSTDRFLRYAARIAIESQPVETWKAKALAESDPRAAMVALVALARTGDHKTQPELLAKALSFPMAALPEDVRLIKLRALQLSFIRQGRPAAEPTRKIIAELDPMFPAPSEAFNREASQMLIYLQAPRVAEKILKEMAAAKTQEMMIHYLFHLRTLPIGQWTLDQRKEYFGYWTKDRKGYERPELIKKWFADAARPYSDGSSFNNFFKNFLKEASQNLSDAEKKELAGILTSIDKASVIDYNVPARQVVKKWTIDELVPMLDQVEKGRNFAKGRDAYFAGQCIKCHRFGEEGGAVGPDLTAIANRFTRRDMLESIIAPSKVISDQYENTTIVTKAEKIITGRVVDETSEKVVIQPDPLSPERVEIKKSDIENREASKVSPMPANLADVLSPEEILDLIAFMESGGRKDYKSFRGR